MALLLLAACEPPSGPRFDRDAAEAKIAKIEAAARKASLHPALLEDTFEPVELSFNERPNPKWNAGILGIEECIGSAPRLAISGSPSWWTVPWAAVRGDVAPEESAPFDLLAHLRYLLVIRTREYTAPVVLDNGQGTFHYQPGRFQGDALLVDLETTRILGGFRIRAENEFAIRLDRSKLQLEADLATAAQRKIRETLAEILKKDQLPFPHLEK